MSVNGRPERGVCTKCHETLVGDQIFHWSPSSWAVWCFPCYKDEHYHNLKRVNSYAGDCDRCNRRMYHGGYPQPIRIGREIVCEFCRGPRRETRD